MVGMLRSVCLGASLVLTLVLLGCGGSADSSGGNNNNNPPPPTGGSATLTWDGPTLNADASPLTDLAGYRVYRSTTSGSYTGSPVATVTANSLDGVNETGRTVTVNNLASGTHYFVVHAFDTSGNESTDALPGEVYKTIP